MMMGFADFPVAALKAIKVHPDSTKKENQQGGADNEQSEPPTSHQASIDGRRQSQPTSGTTSPGESTKSMGAKNASSSFNLGESFAKMGAETPTSPGSDRSSLRPQHRSSSMANALKEQMTRSRSGSGSRSRTSSSAGRDAAEGQGNSGGSRDVMGTFEDVLNTGKGVSKIVSAGFKSPMDFTHGLAKGFHNAPKLYGDNVRKNEPITDFRSGIMAASKEFGYGFYDGITGLVTQPLDGAKKEGAAGFVKGFGKGIGGIVFKPGAAIFGIPAYTMKGVYKELQQHMGSSVQNYIIAARTAQGYDELRSSSQDERENIVRRWYVVQANLKKKRNPHEQLQDLISEQRSKMRQRGDSSSSGKTSSATKHDDDRSIRPSTAGRGDSGTPNLLARLREGLDFQRDRQQNPSTSDTGRSQTEPLLSPSITLTDSTGQRNPATGVMHSSTDPAVQAEEHLVNSSIRAAVADSSRGNADEDALIERAMRASMAELNSRPPNYTETAAEEDMLYREALEASMAEAERFAREHREDEGDEELAQALKASLEAAETGKGGERGQRGIGNDWETSSVDPELQKAISASRAEHSPHAELTGDPPPYEDEKEMGSAVTESKEAAEALKKQEEEERVVLEYVKRQSLMEEEHRKKLKGKEALPVHTTADKGHEDGEDDEEMKRAIKMSLGHGEGKGGSSK